MVITCVAGFKSALGSSLGGATIFSPPVYYLYSVTCRHVYLQHLKGRVVQNLLSDSPLLHLVWKVYINLVFINCIIVNKNVHTLIFYTMLDCVKLSKDCNSI